MAIIGQMRASARKREVFLLVLHLEMCYKTSETSGVLKAEYLMSGVLPDTVKIPVNGYEFSNEESIMNSRQYKHTALAVLVLCGCLLLTATTQAARPILVWDFDEGSGSLAGDSSDLV